MNATTESKKDFALLGRNYVTYEHDIRQKQHAVDIWGITKALINLRTEEKITEGQFIAALKHIFSNYAESKIMEKLDSALDKMLLKHSLS